MDILVEFEDKYGMCDFILYSFGIPFINRKSMEVEINTDNTHITIRRGLGTGKIFEVDSTMSIFDKIIVVYDMDKLNHKFTENYARAQDFDESVKELLDRTAQVYFVPITFAFETMMLHKIDPISTDFSTIYSRESTAKMHLDMLMDIEVGLHPDINNDRYWKRLAKEYRFRIKEARAYIDDGYNIRDALNMITEMGYSNINKHLINWIAGGDITDTTHLLTFDQALTIHKTFETLITDKISSGLDMSIIYNGKKYA